MTNDPSDLPVPMMDAQESPFTAALAGYRNRKAIAFAEEAVIVERFVQAYNKTEAAADLPGGPLIQIEVDNRGVAKSITATNGSVTLAFEENGTQRSASISYGGRTARNTVAIAPEATNFLAIELDQFNERLGRADRPA